VEKRMISSETGFFMVQLFIQISEKTDLKSSLSQNYDESGVKKLKTARGALPMCLYRKGYFTGISPRMATRNSQNFFTVLISTFSSGEWGKRMVGPNEIISRSGYAPPSNPHSSPA
jgi:hypothetical protein